MQGGAGAESFIVTSVGGYTSQVQVVCTVPTQDDMTCTPTPQQVIPPPRSPSWCKPTRPAARSTPQPQSHKSPSHVARRCRRRLLAALVFFLLPFGRRARLFLREGPRRFLVLLMLLAGLAGLGIGCTSTAGSRPTARRWALPRFKVTASAYVDNAVVSQSVYFTVNVTAP